MTELLCLSPLTTLAYSCRQYLAMLKIPVRSGSLTVRQDTSVFRTAEAYNCLLKSSAWPVPPQKTAEFPWTEEAEQTRAETTQTETE